jgi:hypothetical protein
LKRKRSGGEGLARMAIEEMTQQKDWKDHTECLVRLLTNLTESVMRHDSQE